MLVKSFAWLLVATALASLAAAQGIPMPKEGVPAQPKDVASKETTGKTPLDKLKLPPGSILILDSAHKEGLTTDGKLAVMPLEKYQEILDQVSALKKQLKAEKLLPSACKLTGRLDGDFILLRAEYFFDADLPRSKIVLGLQGGHLTDEGDLDGQPPHLEFADDGFLVRVEKEGARRRLLLNLKVPVGLKRVGGPGGVAERGFDLGLPGAAVTTLSLELPGGVKEIRWNDNLEKRRTQNRWELTLGRAKSLTLSWKEPASLPTTGPLLSADSQIHVKLEEGYVVVNADMTLEDLSGQTSKWQLQLPAGAKVDVKSPAGLSAKIVPPETPVQNYVIQLAEDSERVVVQVQARFPRPQAPARVVIGPFVVHNAYRQQGLIAVHAAPDAVRGQRLLFHRYGETFQRDLPKNPGDQVGLFQYWNLPSPGKGPKGVKAPLELEFKADRGQTDSTVDHILRVRPGATGWVIDTTTRIHLKAKHQATDVLDLQWPQPPYPALGALAVGPAAFPASLPWGSLTPDRVPVTPLAMPLSMVCEEDGVEIVSGEGSGRARLQWARYPDKDVTVVLTGKYLAPPGAERVRIELPRPLGTVDRGGKTTVQSDDQLDLHVGPVGSETPAPDRHVVHKNWDLAPDAIDIAWRQHRPEFAVTAIVDVTLHARSAEVQCTLSFKLPERGTQAGLPALRLHVPKAIADLQLEKQDAEELVRERDDRDKDQAWLHRLGEPGAKVEVVLSYDFPLPTGDPGDKVFQVPVPFLMGATRHDTKVRLWGGPGVLPVLETPPVPAEAWRDRSVEVVASMQTLPALVVFSADPRLPLWLRIVDTAAPRLAAVVCDRCLIQALVDEEGRHDCRARFLIRKVNASYVDLEFPMPAQNCVQHISIVNLKEVKWEPVAGSWNVARVQIPNSLTPGPFLLDVEYKLPASFTDGKRPWQSTLFAPQVRGEAYVGKVRWHVALPGNWVAFAAGQEIHWALQGWLLGPEPDSTAAELDAWLTGREAGEQSLPVSLSLVRTSLEPVAVVHFARPLWLVLCSGLVLVVGLGLYLAPWSRTAVWAIVILLGLFFLASLAFFAAWLPPFVMGAQPGLLVLLVLLGVHWMLQERYRRQVVFLPGFTRLKANSSLIRHGSTGSRPREPSTIDAPAPSAGSSQAPVSPSVGSSKGG